jgi:hypothetical protein
MALLAAMLAARGPWANSAAAAFHVRTLGSVVTSRGSAQDVAGPVEDTSS